MAIATLMSCRFAASVTLFVLFTTSALFQLSLAQCTTCHWFGTKSYLCHCASNVACDNNTGACPGACAEGWFGPACQYACMTYAENGGSSNMNWLTDNVDTTCNDGDTQSINILLNTPIFFTWMRLKLKSAVKADAIEIDYIGASAHVPCPSEQIARVDDTTLDISCPSSGMVEALTLSGPGVENLCSLYVSKGHNVAMKKTGTTQSTTYGSFYASNAVDGQMPPYGSADFCSHSDSGRDTPACWTLTFSILVDINSIDVYNRQGYTNRLNGFTINIYNEQSTKIYTYTPPEENQDVYLIYPVGASNVKEIEIILPGTEENILTLCEVVVSGELSVGCAPGTYGLDCEKPCNCADDADCLDHSGGCPSGCAAGFTGKDCLTSCSEGFYGKDCRETCSVHCDGVGHRCNGVNGSCDQGCEVGYIPPLCHQACSEGFYGKDCRETCSVHCDGVGHRCNGVNGSCDQGCEVGYIPPLCHQVCDTGYYGHNCLEACNEFCHGQDNSCDPATGHCSLGCEPGYMSHYCNETCPTGYHGANCLKKCSDHCYGIPISCDRVKGSCDKGCHLGYIPPMCTEVCNKGFYGQHCSKACNEFCHGQDNSCDPVTGHCSLGCVPGYKSLYCNETCSTGYHGANCLKKCSINCYGMPISCHHVKGWCDKGCDVGYIPPLCIEAIEKEYDSSIDGSDGSDGNNEWLTVGIIAIILAVLSLVAVVLLRWITTPTDSESESSRPLENQDGTSYFDVKGRQCSHLEINEQNLTPKMSAVSVDNDSKTDHETEDYSNETYNEENYK